VNQGEPTKCRAIKLSISTLAIALAISTASAAAPETVAIVGATVFNGAGDPPTKSNVVIRDGRIIGVGPG